MLGCRVPRRVACKPRAALSPDIPWLLAVAAYAATTLVAFRAFPVFSVLSTRTFASVLKGAKLRALLGVLVRARLFVRCRTDVLNLTAVIHQLLQRGVS